jgi:Family of unknown function (DUF6879)
MTTRRITEGEFGNLLRTFERSAFRLETRDSYALDYERDDFGRFLAGTPVPPPEVGWWQPWLEQIRRQAGQGKLISRVRILAEPPSDYQRWMLWADPWHRAAGEDIRYMTRSHAKRLDLPLGHDWWLLDDRRVIRMWFTEAGEIDRKLLTDDREIIALYLKWRDLAVRNATTAERFAAA